MTEHQDFVLVTGAAQRLGRAIVFHLAQAGWNIVVHYHTSKTEADETARLIRAMGRSAHAVQADLIDRQAVESLIPSLTAAKCRITGLVNNASLFERDTNDLDGSRHNAVNFEAPQRLSESLSQNLPPETKGAIVNLLDSTPIPPIFNAYGTSKEKLRQSTLALALDFAPRIRVNALMVGPSMKSRRQTDEHFARMVNATPLGLVVPPESVAAAVLFLLENQAITGEIIHVDSGAHLTATTS